MVAGAAKAAVHQRDLAFTAAWLGASFARAKKMPPLDKIVKKQAPTPRRGKVRGWQQQLAAWSRFTDA